MDKDSALALLTMPLLWEDRYTPDTFPPERIKDMTIPECLKFLQWCDYYVACQKEVDNEFCG